MPGLFGFVGIIALILGITWITRKETAWKWQEWENSVRGVQSERNYNWEVASTLRGYFILIVRIGFICYAFYLKSSGVE